MAKRRAGSIRQREERTPNGTTVVAQPLPSEGFRAVEMAWLQRNRDRLALDYPGEWIAVEGGELVAHANSLPDLLRRAAERGHPHPFVTAVSSGPAREFFG